MRMTFIFPIQTPYRISQKFGQNLLGYERFGLKGHDGVDVAVGRGTPIICPADGVVTSTYSQAQPEKGGYGNEVRLLTQSKEQILDWVFAHLLTVLVQPKQYVEQGEVLGLVDSTGFSTGDHLHFGFRYLQEGKTDNLAITKIYLDKTYTIVDYNNGYFGYIDPMNVYKDTPDDVHNVDNRYGQSYSPTREWLWKIRHEKYAMKRAVNSGVPYNERLMKGAIYGYWDIETLVDPAMFAVWAVMTKPEFLKIKRLGRSQSFSTDLRP